jgi:hypothetical protein
MPAPKRTPLGKRVIGKPADKRYKRPLDARAQRKSLDKATKRLREL